MAQLSADQQHRRELINVHRLVVRLEEATTSSTDAAKSSRDAHDYYATLAVLSNIRYAKEMLGHAGASGSSQTRSDLSSRLDHLEAHYKSLHEAAPSPAATHRRERNLERLRPKLVPGQDAAVDSQIGPALSPAAVNDLLPIEGEAEPGLLEPSTTSPRHEAVPIISPLAAPHASEKSTSRSASVATPAPKSTQTMTTLLSHHRSEQESLTDELASMATRLKENSLAFSSLLEKDKSVMENAEGKLEKNLDGMVGQQSRLKGYSKKASVSMWFTIGAVAAVSVAWFFMFGLMRVA